MEKVELSSKEAKNLYQRKWRAANRDRVKKYNSTYWQRKALKMNSKEMEVQACQK
ncbi:hypothetical protein [Bacillus paranthracis]|jgi:hypothetical protein|uniref:hypothetical protein n=1 Tax=Bacillus paranthracis TaxID=2026186 RepID=UPI002852B4B8|nr:hypothetical protein [Bacillus paranthracis]